MVGRGEVLPDRKIKELIRAGVIINADESLVNPGSLDLRVSFDYWKLLGSFLPSGAEYIEAVLKSKAIVNEGERVNKDGFYVELNQPYLTRLVESLDSLESITARIHNKSGRARVGVSAKGLVDKTPIFDSVPAEYKGNIYLEMCATAFSIYVDSGKTAIPQIIFFNGNPQPIQGIDL